MAFDTQWYETQITAYEQVRPLYSHFAEALQRVLKPAITALGIEAIIQARAKTIPSFAEKILRKPCSDPVRQFTDLCGARVIVYRRDHVEPLCTFIRHHFEIDWATTDEDVGQRLKPEEFGYRSVHYTVAFKPDSPGFKPDSPGIDPAIRTSLLERYTPQEQEELGQTGPKYRAEVQVRTLLQHGWAMLVHDTLYKGVFQVPPHLQREASRIAALLENADDEFTRLAQAVNAYQSHFGAYLDSAAIHSEIKTLQQVYRHDANNIPLACRIAALAEVIDDWDTVITTLAPLQASDSAAVHYRLGVAARQDKLKKSAGLRHLERAVQRAPTDGHALCTLAEAYAEDGNPKKALDAYQQAFQLDPTEPRILQAYLYHRLCRDNHVGFLVLLAPHLEKAISTCQQRATVGVELPWAYLESGFFTILLGRLLGGLTAYAKAIRFSVTAAPLVQAGTQIEGLLEVLRTAAVALLEQAQAQLPSQLQTRLKAALTELRQGRNPTTLPSELTRALSGWVELASQLQLLAMLECVRRLLYVGIAVKQARALSLEIQNTLQQLATRGPDGALLPFRQPVVIVAGGCIEEVPGQLQAYRELLTEAFRSFQGTLISGGTTAGIPGMVGDLPAAIRKVAYVPEPLPAGSELHPGYHEIHRTPALGNDFSPLEPLQNWIDLLACGVQPNEVKLFGINGGAIAGFEYQLALALGARVAVLRDSGRAAGELLKDSAWLEPATSDYPNLALLPFDPASAHAFIQFGVPSTFTTQAREQLARAEHEQFRRTQGQRFLQKEPAMAEWDTLPEPFKASNRQLVDYLEHLLAAVSLNIRQVTGREVELFELSKAQIDTMAELEHGRWVVERLLAGWRLGPRDYEKRTSPYLVSWKDLTEEVRQWDRNTVAAIPKRLAECGYEVYSAAGVGVSLEYNPAAGF